MEMLVIFAVISCQTFWWIKSSPTPADDLHHFDMERLVCSVVWNDVLLIMANRRGDRCRFNEVNRKPPIIKRPPTWVYHIGYEHPIHPIIANTSHRGPKNNLTISTTQDFREGLIFAYSYIVFRCESIFWITLPVTLLLFQDDRASSWYLTGLLLPRWHVPQSNY